MKWNGRSYRPPGYGIKIYPTKQDSIAELLKPLGEKERKGNVWIPVLNQPINVLKQTQAPVITPSVTPTQTGTPTGTPTQTPTQTGSGTPTPTPTGTSTPTPSPSTIPSPTITYLTTNGSSSNLSTYTYSSVSFGSPGLIVVSVGAFGNYTLTSLTIGGVSAVKAISLTSGGSVKSDIWYAEVTGTTGNIVVNYGSQMSNNLIGVWRINNYSSTTPVFSGSTQGTSGSISITTSSLDSGDVGIGSMNCTYPSTPGSQSWTNATENFNNFISEFGIGNQLRGAEFTTTTSGTRTITVSNLNGESTTLLTAVWS